MILSCRLLRRCFLPGFAAGERKPRNKIGRRFGKARAEMELADQCDYSVVNDEV